MVVSTHLPFTTALMEEPFPKWQTMTLELSLSRPKNSTARLETKLWEVPWSIAGAGRKDELFPA